METLKNKVPSLEQQIRYVQETRKFLDENLPDDKAVIQLLCRKENVDMYRAIEENLIAVKMLHASGAIDGIGVDMLTTEVKDQPIIININVSSSNIDITVGTSNIDDVGSIIQELMLKILKQTTNV